MSKSVFYHAGCPVCINAEHDIIGLFGADKVEVVHLGSKSPVYPKPELPR